MPVTITTRGADENVLAQVRTDGAIASAYNGNTHKAIEDAATEAAVALTQGNDLNMLEQLAAGAAAPYVFALDDDGTLAGDFAKPQLVTDAPDYMSFSRVLTGIAGTGMLAGSIEALNEAGSFALQGDYMALGEFAITAAPGFGEVQSQGVAVIANAAGVPSGIFGAGLANNPGLDGFNCQTTLGPGAAPDDVATALVTLVGARVGLYVVCATGQVHYLTSSGETGAITGGLMNIAHRVSPVLYLDDNTPASAGETVAGGLYLDAADLTLAYPVGTVDVYGVVI